MGLAIDNHESRKADRRSVLHLNPTRRWRDAKFLLPLLIAGAAIAVLYWFPPDRTFFYPRCLLYGWTGWQCPGCGGLRAAHELLHGRIAEAFRLNSLMILLLSLAGAYAGMRAWQLLTGREFGQWVSRPIVVWVLVFAALVFGLARNLMLNH